MTEADLKIVLQYCWKLSRLVSPREARSLQLNNFDGAMCNFLDDLSEQGPTNFNVVSDEFYSAVFQRMKEDLGYEKD